MIGLAIVILPLLVLVVTVHGWLERDAAASELAQEAARALAVARNEASGVSDVDAAELRLEAMMNSPLRPCPQPTGCVQVTIAGSLDPGSRVEVAVAVWMPGPVVPMLGPLSGFWVTTRHTEVVDPYRSAP